MVSSTVPLSRAGRRGSMLRPGTAGPTTRIFTGTVRASPNRADGDMTLNPLGIVHSGSKLGPRPRRKATPPSEPAEGEDDRPPPPPSPTAERLFESDVADKLALLEHKFIDMHGRCFSASSVKRSVNWSAVALSGRGWSRIHSMHFECISAFDSASTVGT